VFEDSEVVVIAPEALLLPQGEVPPYERLKVKGILSTGVADIDSKVIYYLRGQTLKMFQNAASHEAGIEARFADPDHADTIQNQLLARGVKSETWGQRNSALFYALKLEKISIGAILGLSSLIASFSIVAVLMLLMTQKRRDLGLLMALGLSKRRTRWTFASVGLILSCAGIGGGLVIGLGLSLLISRYPLNVLPEIYHDRSIPATVNYTFVLTVVVVASVIAFLSSWIPAWQNTRMTPSEALRGQLSDEDS
jgi:lipoprotein-releasing system permease protein